MKTMLRLALAAAVLGLAAPALAQTATATFQVTATVPNSCRIAAGAIAFGNYDPLAATAADATGTVTVTCTRTSAWWVGLDAGLNAGLGASGARAMGAGGSFLGYDLYRDATRTTPWGNTQAEGSAGTGTGVAQPITVYGRIPASQTGVPAGAYADTVTATVNF
ncbi:MAG: spore coat protein U domain-containing protein [Deltaproteobacteria bacterium]|nr:spore coat protein U domain-containing protein [Deltaproteobacteria bacterium]